MQWAIAPSSRRPDKPLFNPFHLLLLWMAAAKSCEVVNQEAVGGLNPNLFIYQPVLKSPYRPGRGSDKMFCCDCVNGLFAHFTGKTQLMLRSEWVKPKNSPSHDLVSIGGNKWKKPEWHEIPGDLRCSLFIYFLVYSKFTLNLEY